MWNKLHYFYLFVFFLTVRVIFLALFSYEHVLRLFIIIIKNSKIENYFYRKSLVMICIRASPTVFETDNKNLYAPRTAL